MNKLKILMGWGISTKVECLPSLHLILSLTFSATYQKEKKKTKPRFTEIYLKSRSHCLAMEFLHIHIPLKRSSQ